MRLMGLATFNTIRRNWLFVLAIIMTFMLFGMRLNLAHADNSTGSSAQDCNANAVIYCGVSSVSDLQKKYSGGDSKNASGSAQDIYGYFGISSTQVNQLGSQDVRTGEVYSDGRVTLNGQTVATNAITAGRQNMAGSTKHTIGGTVFYTRPVSVSFASSPLKAFVVMNNGKFAYAILESCGNPVKATPTPPKVSSTPKPTKTPTTPTKTTTAKTTTSVCSGNTTNTANATSSQGGNCSTNTTVIQQAPPTPSATTSPSPSAQCTSLQITPNVGNSETVTATASVNLQNGAQVGDVNFNWGDGTTTDNGTNLSANHTYSQAGTYNITATITFKDSTVTAADQANGSPTNQTMNASVNSGAMAASGTNQAGAATANNTTATTNSTSSTTPQSVTCQGSAAPTTPAAPTQTQPTPSPATTSSATQPAPQALVNTGPGQVVGLFTLTSLWGAAGYRWYLGRRLARL